jgi:hypothetical protein
MTEEEWARERADVLDVEPQFGDGRDSQEITPLGPAKAETRLDSRLHGNERGIRRRL